MQLELDCRNRLARQLLNAAKEAMFRPEGLGEAYRLYLRFSERFDSSAEKRNSNDVSHLFSPKKGLTKYSGHTAPEEPPDMGEQ
tara:strand:+ start:4867 stop:5118 length:252 start_codon:yes stop_codon:yes gene_type:complete